MHNLKDIMDKHRKFIDNLTKQSGQDCTINALPGNHMEIKAGNIEVRCKLNTYHPATSTITFKEVKIKPFYYKPMLGMIHKKLPSITYSNKLLTCKLL